MKKDWTYKKLGEVLVVERGGSPRPIQAYLTTDPNGLNWIKIGDAVEGSKYITSTKEKIKPEGLHKTRFVNKGDFILSNSMSFGRPYILDIDGCIHDGWLVLRDKENVFDKSFLYYYLSSPNVYNEFKRLAVGGVVNNLNSELVRGVTLPIPPISIQESIVRELDAIHGILEKKQEQLRELDNLAQAIFYDMFGDPITNPKQWEVKKLIELVHKDCPVSYGIVQPGDGEEKGVPVVRPVDLKDSDYIGRENLKLTTQKISDSYSRTILRGDEILICVRGTTGLLGLVSSALKGCNVTRGIVPLFFADDIATKLFIFAALKTPAIQSIIADKTYGATLKQINIKDLRDIEFPLPPLPLQQSFAAKIEAIEAQKQAVQQSIREVEALLAERMDHYFS